MHSVIDGETASKYNSLLVYCFQADSQGERSVQAFITSDSFQRCTNICSVLFVFLLSGTNIIKGMENVVF